ncbi:MAG TPA: FxLYD domain-containing protein [Candidatus Cybelea sp.]|nr:FxLYD domain-containing protein [Candidatus Cybelea sp.]
MKCSCKECGNHIEFPVTSAGTVVTCPHCGQWTELKPDELPQATPANRNGLLPAILLGCIGVAMAIGAFWFVRNRIHVVPQTPITPIKVAAAPTNPPPTNPAPIKPAPGEKRQKSLEDLKIGPVQLEKAKVGSLVYAVGVVTNASEFQRFGVQIKLDLFGKNGKNLGTATDYKDIIEPNHEWQFHALILDPRTTSAKVSSLTEQ